jgi:hypothetical protein
VREDTAIVKINSEVWSTKGTHSGEGERRLNCPDLVTEKTARVEAKGDVRLPIQMLYDTSTRKLMMWETTSINITGASHLLDEGLKYSKREWIEEGGGGIRNENSGMSYRSDGTLLIHMTHDYSMRT